MDSSDAILYKMETQVATCILETRLLVITVQGLNKYMNELFNLMDNKGVKINLVEF